MTWKVREICFNGTARDPDVSVESVMTRYRQGPDGFPRRLLLDLPNLMVVEWTLGSLPDDWQYRIFYKEVA